MGGPKIKTQCSQKVGQKNGAIIYAKAGRIYPTCHFYPTLVNSLSSGAREGDAVAKVAMVVDARLVPVVEAMVLTESATTAN